MLAALVLALASPTPDPSSACYYHCLDLGDSGVHYTAWDEERGDLVCYCDHARRMHVKHPKEVIPLTPNPLPTHYAPDYMPLITPDDS